MSHIKPKKIDEALRDVHWVNAMHEELNNFKRNQVWELVERPSDHNVIVLDGSFATNKIKIG